MVFNGYNVAVSVGLYPGVGQTPFQNGIVVIVRLVRLQVCAQHLHGQGQGLCALNTAHHGKALHLHFFHKVPGRIAVIIYPRREQIIFFYDFHKPLRDIGIVDRITRTKAQQAPFKPLVIGNFVLLYTLLQTVCGQKVHLRNVFAVAAPAHKQQACTGQVCGNGKVNAADTVRAPELFKVKRGFIVYVVKGKPRRFYRFPDVEFFTQNAGKFVPVLLCPVNFRGQVVRFLDAA